MITYKYIGYIAERAKGYLKIPSLCNDEKIKCNKRLIAEVYKYGSKIFCTMYHPGKQFTRLVNGNVTPLAPSAIKDPLCQTPPCEITVEEIHNHPSTDKNDKRWSIKAGKAPFYKGFAKYQLITINLDTR